MTLARRLGQRGFVLGVMTQVGFSAYPTGDWSMALDLLDEVLSEEIDERDWSLVAQPWITLRRSRGEPLEAEGGRLLTLLANSEEHILQTQVHDVRARLWFIDGRLADARREALVSHAMEPFPEMLQLAIRASLWLRDREATEAHLREFEDIGAHGPMLNAQRTVFRAGLAALRGETPEALRLYRDGRRGLADRGLDFLLALSAIDMATVLPDGEGTAEAVADARTVLGDLGARPFLERLDSLIAERAGDAPPLAAEASGASLLLRN